MKRRKLRELAIKALYACDIEKGDPIRHLDYIAGDGEMSGLAEGKAPTPLSGQDAVFARALISGVASRKEELDSLIGGYAVDWDISRIGAVERNILRLAMYEMLYGEKLAPPVAINEALEMIKVYCDGKAAGFANGILGKKAEEIKAGQPGEADK